MGGDGMKNDKRKTAQAAATAKRGIERMMIMVNINIRKANNSKQSVPREGGMCK